MAFGEPTIEAERLGPLLALTLALLHKAPEARPTAEVVRAALQSVAAGADSVSALPATPAYPAAPVAPAYPSGPVAPAYPSGPGPPRTRPLRGPGGHGDGLTARIPAVSEADTRTVIDGTHRPASPSYQEARDLTVVDSRPTRRGATPARAAASGRGGRRWAPAPCSVGPPRAVPHGDAPFDRDDAPAKPPAVVSQQDITSTGSWQRATTTPSARATR
ncbi:hypothetical protein NKH77_32210 [Streptomyces sp. M19]